MGGARRTCEPEGAGSRLPAALAAHRREPKGKPAEEPKARTVEHYTATGRLKPKACIHCHQVYDFRRQALQTAGKWRLDELWVYPLPENVGLTLDVDEGDQ